MAQTKAGPGRVTEATLVDNFAQVTTAMDAKAADMKVGYVNAGGGAKRIATILGNHTKIAMVGATSETCNPKLSALFYCGDEPRPDLSESPTAKELGYDVVFASSLSGTAPKAPRRTWFRNWRVSLSG